MLALSLFIFLIAWANPLSGQMTGFAAADAISRENRARPDSIAESVDTGTGAFIFETSVMSVLGGRDVIVDLAYNSLLTSTTGPLGPGWSHPFLARIDGDPNGVVTVHWDPHKKNSFRFTSEGLPYEGLGLAVVHDLLQRRNDGTWRLRLHDGTIYEFDSDGRLERIGNKLRQFLEVGYDGEGRVGAILEPISNRRISFRYRKDGSGRLQHLQDAEDRVVFFDYDERGRLNEIHDPATISFVFGANFPGIPIPDNDPAGIVHTINVEREDPIGLVLFARATLNHSDPSDLRLRLTSPAGTTAEFTTGTAGPTWDLSQVMVDFFQGENPQGTWRVEVADLSPGETGFLNTFRLQFTDPTHSYQITYNDAGRIAAITAPDDGLLVANTYDAQGRVIAQEDGRSDNEPAAFSYTETSSGLVTTFTDRAGATTIFEHDRDYNLIRLTDALGATTRFEYDSSGNLIQETDALGRITRFSYTSAGNLERYTDPMGRVTFYQYDNENNVRGVTDALGKRTAFTYNASNALEQVRDAANNVDRREYSANAQLSSSLFSDGAQVNYSYTRGLPTSASHPVSGSTGARYDNIGRVLSLEGPGGATIETRYNDRSQVIERNDALGGISRWEFDSRGRQTAFIDAKGNRTQYAYDGNDNVVSITNARGETTRFAYDGEDRLIAETDPLGNVTRFEYDAVGQQVKEIDPLGNEIRTEYDAVGNVVAVFGPDGKAIERTAYDQRDLPIRIEDALGGTTRLEYDEIGRLVSVTDALGRTRTLEYDELDRPTRSEDALGREAQRTYVADDMTRRLLDARGGAGWNFRYDLANRMTEVNTPWGETTDIDYDERDNVSQVSYPSGRSLAFDYDLNNHISRVVRGTSGLIEPDITFEYDANGNVIDVGTKAFSDTEPQSQLVRSYDELDRMTVFRDAHGDELRYAYDAGGRLAELTYPSGNRVRYEYDAANRLTTVTDWANRVTSYSYDDAGNLARIELPNGTVRTLEYDDAGRITRRRETDAQGLGITDFKYDYDVAGQVTVESSGLQRPPYRPQTVRMTYERGTNRLTAFNGMNVAHDEDGNVTRAPAGEVLTDFQYDNLGNMIQAGPARFTYDAEGRLITYTDGQGGSTTLTVNPMPDLSQVLVKTDSGGRTRYIWGIGLLYEEANGSILVHHYDLRGNTVAFSDSQGAVVGQVSYGPFGELGDRKGQTDSLFLFGGMFGVITHPNGLNYMRFRWYSPQLKRFLSVDSLFGEIGNISSLNRYIYAGNNAIASADPGGEFAVLVPVLIAVAVGAASAGTAVLIDAATTGMLGPPERYVAVFFAGAAVGLCGGCGFVATVGAATIGGVVGGGAAGLIADAADDGEIQGQRTLDAVKEGAITGAATGLTAGVFRGAGNVIGRALARRAAAQTAGRQAARAAARGGRLAGRAGRVGRTAGRRGGRSGVRGRGGRGARRGAERIRGRRGARHRRRPVSDSEVSELLSRAPFRGNLQSVVTRTLARNGARTARGLQVRFRLPVGRSGTGAARFRVVRGGRAAVNRGQGSRYGEFRHLRLHRGHRSRARVGAPNRPAQGGLN